MSTRSARRTRRLLAAALAVVLLVPLGGAVAGPPDDEVPAWDARTGRLDPAEFAAPPATSRPHAFWFWNGKLTEEELSQQLDDMRAKGVEEFFIHPRQGLGGEFGGTENAYYLSTDYFDKVGFVLEGARARGMKAWLYDDLNWPSGYAGGRTVRGGLVDGRTVQADPDFLPWYLAPVAADVTGPAAYDAAVPLGGPRESLVAAVALPKAATGSCTTGGQARGVALDGSKGVELTSQVSGGRLRWQVPAGEWCLLHLVQRPLVNYHPDLEPDEPYVDMLNPAVTEKFIDITHETYAKRFGPHFGSTIQGIFNDEPGFYNNFPDNRGGIDSLGSIPWTPGFRDYLTTNAGYDLTARLAAIWYDTGDATTRTRVDFHDALSDRYNEAHTIPLSRWAADHDIALISNPLVEEDLGSHRLIEGGSWFEMSRHYQLPGMDLISGLDTNAITPKLNSSVAHLFDRPRNLAETFGAFGWDLTMQEMKRTVAWEAAGGVDLIDNHAFYYSIEGQRAFESQPSEFTQNLFWPRFGQYSELAGRLVEPARGATAMNPVGVLYPSTSVMATGTPWNVRGFAGNGADLGPVDASWKGTSNDLLAAQLDFDYLDELALAGDPDLGQRFRIDGGRLRLHRQEWQAVVLPRTAVLTLEAVDLLQRFADDGGTVVAVDGLATKEARGRDAALSAKLRKLFGTDPAAPVASQVAHGNGLAAYLPNRAGLATLVRQRVTPGVTLAPASNQVRVRHVKRGADDAFLVVNLSGQQVNRDATFAAGGVPELWDPNTGSTSVATTFRSSAGRTTVPLRLDPYDAVWVTFRPGAHTAGRTPHLTATNAEPGGVAVHGRDLRARLLVDQPGEVFAVGEYSGRTYGATTTVDDPLTPLRLDGDWSFRFDRDGATPVTRPLGSWTDLDPRWSGSGTYTKEFTVPAGFLAGGRRVELDLGQVRELATVSVNGAPATHLDWAPYTVDVTDQLREGTNTLSVTVTNTQTNEIESRPNPSGLLGPVALRPRRVVDLDLRSGAAITSYDLSVDPASPSASPGRSTTVTATVTGIAPDALTGTLTARGPAGWTVEPASRAVSVPSGGAPVSVATPVTVTVPPGTPDGSYPVTIGFAGAGGRTVEREVPVRVSAAAAAWEFTAGAEGWTAANQVTPFVAAEGTLRFSATGGDPYVVGPGVDLTMSGGLTVEIELSSSIASSGQLFWATTEGGFAESRSARFAVAEGNHTYRVQVPAGAAQLRQLRLDPTTGPADLVLDAVRILPS